MICIFYLAYRSKRMYNEEFQTSSSSKSVQSGLKATETTPRLMAKVNRISESLGLDLGGGDESSRDQ